MKETELIRRSTETSEFKKLQSIGLKFQHNQRQFDLLTVYKDLIDEMAWSRLFAYLFDSTQNHGLEQSALRKLLKQIPGLKQFSDLLPSETDSETICLTEWKTENSRRVDILIKIVDRKGNTKAILAIENKIDSGEQNNQIRDYQKSLNLAFPRIPKALLYLTPDGRLTQTSDENPNCSCVSVSFDILSKVCEQIISNATGQGYVFLEVLKNHIDKLINNQLMDKEALQLIKKLYKDPEYRQAIKLIGQYSPNTKSVFDSLTLRLNNSKSLPFARDTVSYEYYPKTSPNPHEFKLYIPDLANIGHRKGFHGIYMLHCDNLNPDIGDYFTLRLVVGFFNRKDKGILAKQGLRNKTLSAFSLTNSLGTNKHWGPWTCIWTGNSFKLSDLGDGDVEGLRALLIKGIKDTYTHYKSGLKKLAGIRL